MSTQRVHKVVSSAPHHLRVTLSTLVVIHISSYGTMVMMTYYVVAEVLLYIHRVMNMQKLNWWNEDRCSSFPGFSSLVLFPLCFYRLFICVCIVYFSVDIFILGHSVFTQVTRCYCKQFTIIRIAHQLFIRYKIDEWRH